MSECDFSKKADRSKFYNSYSWRKLRLQALERDNYECVWCKEEGLVTTQDRATLEVDHIEEIKDNPKRALDIDNLRTLC